MIERLISFTLQRLFSSLVPLVLAASASFVFAQAPGVPVAPVTLNFVDADIDVVAKAVGELTGKTFVIDQRVKGKINIQSAKGVAPNLAYPTFLAALRMAGFAVVESGNIVRIVPEVDAKTLPTPVGNAGAGVIATKVLPIANQSAAQIANAVRPMLSAANVNALVVYAPGNALIVTDYSDNIRRIEALVSRLDTPSIAAPEVYTLANANALDVVFTVNRVFNEGALASASADARDRLSVTADARSNSVIVRSEDGNRLARAKALIQDLDRPTAAPGNIRIVYLKHGDATQIALTLRRVLGVDGGANPSNPSTGSSANNSPLASLLPGATGNNGTNSGSNPSLNSAVSAFSAASAGSGSLAASGNLPQLSQSSQTAFTAAGATVYADSAINALVISAPTAIYNNLRAVIEQLDVRRAQVFIEALIVEVQADKVAEFGIQWQVLDGLNKSNTQGFGGTNFGTGGNNIFGLASGLASGTTTPAQGLNVGLARGAITIGKNQFFNLGLLARALQNDSSANILSMPTLLALDNEEARFSGGQNVPFLTGQYATTSGNNSVTPFNTVERRDVGLTLKVKPLITEGGAIRLQLYQEVSNIIESAAVAQGLGSVSKRVLESSVLADDGQIVVLGGLLQEGFSNDQDKVPILGDAPFIGNFFRYDSRKRTKTNLMIFLRPTVLRDSARTSNLSNERYRALGIEQQGVDPEPRFMLPEMNNPRLPLGEPSVSAPMPAPAKK